jgi:NAD(P)H-nitrite reductase large subunit
LGQAATGLDLESKALIIELNTFHFSKLVIAAGVSSRKLEDRGDSDKVQMLRTIDDVLAIEEKLRSSGSIAMIGAGVLGCAMTLVFSQLDYQVRLLERLGGPQMLETVGYISQRIHEELVNHDIITHFGVAIGYISLIKDRFDNGFKDGNKILVEMVVAAVGARPNTDWLPSDLIDVSDGVLCDLNGQVAPDVHAIEDVARWQLRSEQTARRI